MATSKKKINNKNSISIQPIDTKILIITLKGLTPLLMHRFSDRVQESILEKQMRVGKSGKEARNIEQEVEDSLYIIDKKSETYGIPAIGLKSAIVGACRQLADKSLPMTVIKGGVHVFGFWDLNKGVKPKTGGELLKINYDSRDIHQARVVIGQGTTDIRFRPRFYDWSVKAIISYNAGRISVDQLISLIQLAGYSQGLCDNRPERGGSFGQFIIDDTEDVLNESFIWTVDSKLESYL